MSHPDDSLADKGAALETEMAEMKARLSRVAQDAAAAQVLARGADRDVADLTREIGEFRTHNTTLHNTTREDLRDVREDLRETRQDLKNLREATTNGFVEMRGKLDAAAAGQAQIAAMLTTLLQRDDQNDDTN
ncbi:hypothetical protein BAY61_32100 (plasmid) [Prauserella marina]|uniref:Uncharacterized protein n=1 Tax=Prauserella marina TaxID=530584 RepID=A0A222W1C5_9PSEU|nr:hypothetical protein [Prauserella marina]ASR40008.1 hypothetical protein BAY61_32100 [Prauserella marina]PWV71428.1 hypothetical protein DES30_112144 [Prauserella marina]SDD97854.1 hypothetical protein SAMN05421630_115135 [Prauserella marina]